MAALAYTKRLYLGPLPGPWSALVDPVAYEGSLVAIEVHVAGASPVHLQISIGESSGSVSSTFIDQAALEPASVFRWEGRLAVQPGDSIWANTVPGDSCSAVLTAYQFA